MNFIKKKLINLIKKTPDGITLDKYIEVCLFDKFGYYNTHQPIGQKEDFTTAPEISQLFGEILGLYIYDLWSKYIKCSFNIIELGPGKGTLISDILQINKSFELFNSSMFLNLIEINKELINLQKRILIKNDLNINKITWNNSFNSIKNRPSIIFANEFFDCFAIKQYIKINKRWNEKKVNYRKKDDIFYINNTIINDKSLSIKLDKYATINKYKENSLIEFSQSQKKYFNKICKFVKKNSGVIIIFDYGYIDPINYSTLQSVKYHCKTSIFNDPGNQDITSLVNFKTIADISEQNNLNVYGPFTQRDFLIKNGIIERKKKILLKANNQQKKDIENGFIRLISKDGMGTIFKCIIISSFNFQWS